MNELEKTEKRLRYHIDENTAVIGGVILGITGLAILIYTDWLILSIVVIIAAILCEIGAIIYHYKAEAVK